MSKKIGHDYNRDPYPWDLSQKHARSAEWTCCDMALPATYNICPACENARPVSDADEQTDDLM
jgi:hypothetical protein